MRLRKPDCLANIILETRFRDDYTDPDPLLAETLSMYADLAEASGDLTRAIALRKQAAQWARQPLAR